MKSFSQKGKDEENKKESNFWQAVKKVKTFFARRYIKTDNHAYYANQKHIKEGMYTGKRTMLMRSKIDQKRHKKELLADFKERRKEANKKRRIREAG